MRTELSVIAKKHVRSIPAALKALDALSRQVSSARTYEGLRKLVDVATAIKTINRDIVVVKQRAEDVILDAYRRIAEELRKVPKAKGGGQLGKDGFRSRAKSIGRAATGIAKDTRSRLGKLADKSPKQIKEAATKLRAEGKDASPTAVIRELTQGNKKTRRDERERALARKIVALPDKRYGVIVADPEWQWEPWSHKTGMDRAAANHYPTSVLPVIKARDVPSISAKDCVLFLWATGPMNPHALIVMSAWEFDYKAQYVWGKDKFGTGYWNREKHELLLIGTRGDIPCPAPGTQWDSLIMAPRGKHSEKPEDFLKMIESYYPNLPKIELNARKRRKGWDAWGAEAPAEAAE